MANRHDDSDRIEESLVEHKEKVKVDSHQAQGTESFEEMSVPTESDTMHPPPPSVMIEATEWNDPEDPQDPYNWPSSIKHAVAIIISLGQLITLMTSSMMAAALLDIAHDLNMGASTTQLSFSIFVLGLAFGPLLIAPLSEVFGRKPVWLGSNIFYLCWNALCPVGESKVLLIIARFLAGFGASSGITLTGPIMADMYSAKDRGKSIALAAIFPYLGPALGPIVGGIVSEHVSWPWLFWVLSIADGVLVCIALPFLRESYTPILLQRRRREENSRNLRVRREEAEEAEEELAFVAVSRLLQKLKIGILRPWHLFLRHPIIPLLSFIMAIEFGVYLLLLSIYATLFISTYHESPTISSLHYIAVAVGATIASQGGGRLMDLIYKRLLTAKSIVQRPPTECQGERASHAPPTPEFRVPLLALGSIALPIGLLWTGWSAEAKLTWIVVDIGACIFTTGCFFVAQAVLAYLLDEFPYDSASANAAVRMLSNILGFVFPLFAPQLYARLGYGWGSGVLALVWFVFGLPAPIILWIWGAKIRRLGRHEEVI